MKLKFTLIELLGFLIYWTCTILYIYMICNLDMISDKENKLIFPITFGTIIIGISIIYQMITNHFNFIVKIFTKKFTINLPS